MRLKIDTVTRTRSATQDGTRDKLGIRAQVLDLDAEEDALELAGQVVEASFVREQQPLPLSFESDEEETPAEDDEEEEPLPFDQIEEKLDERLNGGLPSAGRRRRGTRSSEQVARSRG